MLDRRDRLDESDSPGQACLSFGERLRRLRARSGFSQEVLAERANLSVAAVAALEQGQRRAPYRYTITLLARALGLTPEESAELDAAAHRARARPAAKTAETVPTFHNFPDPLTPFIARDEVAEITRLLERSRLVTITGSGGIGKTRTAIEVARQRSGDLRESWFVDLFPIRDGKLVAREIASAVLPPSQRGENSIDALIDGIGSRAILIIVDNCEHVVADAADAIGALMRACAQLIVLTTSREPLAISGEVTFRLPSLRLPDDRIATLDEAGQYPALDLFVRRAQAADAHWSFDPERLMVAADICRRLEGIPLAIELAASRLPSIGLDALRDRLGDGLTLSGIRDLPQRHQTITATITWSYDLLDANERLVLRRLSVFAASFPLSGAEYVCSDRRFPASAVADALSRLVHKSLVNVVNVDDATHYVLLGSIRAFASVQLSSAGEVDRTLRRHAAWLAGGSNDTDPDHSPP